MNRRSPCLPTIWGVARRGNNNCSESTTWRSFWPPLPSPREIPARGAKPRLGQQRSDQKRPHWAGLARGHRDGVLAGASQTRRKSSLCCRGCALLLWLQRHGHLDMLCRRHDAPRCVPCCRPPFASCWAAPSIFEITIGPNRRDGFQGHVLAGAVPRRCCAALVISIHGSTHANRSPFYDVKEEERMSRHHESNLFGLLMNTTLLQTTRRQCCWNLASAVHKLPEPCNRLLQKQLPTSVTDVLPQRDSGCQFVGFLARVR